MREYYNNPEATKKTLRTGWLHTGDMGYLDEEDYLFIVDRKHDMIIRGGENIYPKELEEILHENPEIQQAAVIGVPDSVMGEAVMAFCVPLQKSKLTIKQIQAFCQRKMADYKVPKYFYIIESLPLNPSGKIDKIELKNIAIEKFNL
jgi:acyl-CoA synthetase (AMP-forming)/AMP-acid ligase II